MLMPSALARYRMPIITGVIIAVAGGYFALGAGNGAGGTYTVVRADTARTVAVSGTIKAASSADLGFAQSGRIKGAYVSVGQRVAPGTVLAEIENGDELAAVAKARANLTSLKTGTRPEEIASAETAVEGDRAALEDAIRSAYATADDAVRNRADALFSTPLTNPTFKYPNGSYLKNIIESERSALATSLTDWRDALNTLTPETAVTVAREAQTVLTQVETFLANVNRGISEALLADQADASAYSSSIATARSNVTSASITLTKDQNTLADDEKTLALKRAGSTAEDIAAGEADLANAIAALGKTRVIAPFAGIVTKMDAKAGEVVSPSTSEIAMQSDGLYQIEIYVPEVSIDGVAVGNPATTTLDTYGPSVTFPAKVIAVDPAETVKDGVPTYKTTLAFLAADPRIRSGMTANVVVTTGILRNAIVIPSGAAGRDPDGTNYVSLRSGKKVVHRLITLGETPSLGTVEVTDGLADGDTILLTPR